MKVKAVINKPEIKLDSTGKSSVVSAVVIFSGVIAGIALYIVSDEALLEDLGNRFILFANEFINKNKPEIFSGLIFQDIIYCAFMLVFAFCIFGTPIVFLLSFIKAMGLGLLTTYIYDIYALKGIEYCLLVIFPGKLILIFAMILLTQNCYVNSTQMTKKLLYQSDGGVSLKKYILRTQIILIVIIISSITDFITLNSFSSLFGFI